MKFPCSFIFCAVLAMITLVISGSFSNPDSFAIAETQPDLVQKLETESLQEKKGFLIQQYPVNHQGANKLNITLSYIPKTIYSGESSSADNTVKTHDCLMVYRQIIDFLNHYPNENDYWESVNRHLTEAILQNNSMIASVTATLEVLPTQQEPYTRSTTVTYTDDGRMLESWSFVTRQISVQHQGEHQLNLRVKYRYRDNLSDADYPNFIPIYVRIEQFFLAYINPTDSWETVNRNLVNTVLQEYPTIESFTSNLEIKPTPDKPYNYFTMITRLQPDS